MGQDLFLHVVIGIREADLDAHGAVLPVQVIPDALHRLLAGLEAGPVVVPEDPAELGLALVPFHAAEVVEALITLGVGGAFRRGNHGDQLRRHQTGVLHLVLGVAGVDVDPVDHDLGAGGVEILILQRSQRSAVHGVGKVRSQQVQVNRIGPSPHFLVGGDADRHPAVRQLRVLRQVGHGREDLRHARLVVGPQERRAVRHDQLLADLVV